MRYTLTSGSQPPALLFLRSQASLAGLELSQLWFTNELDLAKTGLELTWRSWHEGKHKKKNGAVNCPPLTLLDAHSGTEFKRALEELVISKLCSACRLTNGVTKQILHLLKVSSFVWEESPLDICSRPLQRRAELHLHKARGKGKAGRETWQR